MEQITIVTKCLLLSCFWCAKDCPEKEKKRILAPSDQTQYPPQTKSIDECHFKICSWTGKMTFKREWRVFIKKKKRPSWTVTWFCSKQLFSCLGVSAIFTDSLTLTYNWCVRFSCMLRVSWVHIAVNLMVWI